MPTQLYCTISSCAGVATGDDAYDTMSGLHHNAELQVLQLCCCSPRLPLTMMTFSICRTTTYFHQHLRSLIYNDDDRALHDLSADSTMTSPLLCDTAHLSVGSVELLCDLYLPIVQSQAV